MNLEWVTGEISVGAETRNRLLIGAAEVSGETGRFVVTDPDTAQWTVTVTRRWPDIVCATCGDYVYLATDQAPESMRGVWSDSAGDRACADAGDGPHTPVIADGFPGAGNPPPF